MTDTFNGFPRCVADCGRLLLVRRVATGYRTLPLAPDTTLAEHFGAGGGYVITYGRMVDTSLNLGHEVRFRNDGPVFNTARTRRPLVTFYGDGRMKLSIYGRATLEACARINACLPAGWRVAPAQAGSACVAMRLLRQGEAVATFTRHHTFDPTLAAEAIMV